MEERIIDKYPFIPTSIIKLKRHKKERKLRENREVNSGDKYYTNSSRKTKSYFDKDIAEFILKYYARNAKNILDPFAGWGERNKIASDLDYNYKGYDISSEALRFANETFNVINNLADSRNLPLENSSQDFCYSCPPYFNLEKYENSLGQLSVIKDYNEFLIEYEKIIKEIYRCLKTNSKCVFVVGDFRIKNVFYDFSSDTINIFKKCGFNVFDKLIIDKSINYRISMFLPQADKLGYTIKLHEYILVFQK